MNYQILNFKLEDQIGVLAINRPSAMNALNKRFFSEMDWLISSLKTRDDICTLIITGEGKAFVAGADISEMTDMSSKEGTGFSLTGQLVFKMIEDLPFPVIAAINGYALGGGCELAMACDIRIASENAKFGQPEVNLGLIPGYGATQRLSRLIGLGNALNLLLIGEVIDAPEALRIGLIQKIVSSENLMSEALKMANIIKAKGRNAVRLAKLVTRKGLQMNFDDACNFESQKFGSLFKTAEMIEGTKAFLEKRKPNWSK